MARRKTKAELLADVPLETISKMTKPENIAQLRKDVATLRAGYRRRVGAFNRKGLKSYAQIAVENQIKHTKNIPVSKMSSNQLLLEYARYAQFFHDVTSTERGIKRVNREQDARIFGVDSRGRPLRTMTQDEREAYWKLYDEFKKDHKEDFAKYQSGRVITALGEIDTSKGLDQPDLTEYFNKFKEHLQEKYEQRNRRNASAVQRGRRNN